MRLEIGEPVYIAKRTAGVTAALPSRALVQLPDAGQELAARAAEPDLVLLEASQHRHVALTVELLADPLGVVAAGAVTACAHIVLCLARR